VSSHDPSLHETFFMYDVQDFPDNMLEAAQKHTFRVVGKST